MPRLTGLFVAAALLAGLASPASAFNMRQALQAVENLGQWSVMAQQCGAVDSARQIRSGILSALATAEISNTQRERLSSELQYWVKTINRNFKTGGLNVVTACPIWHDNGETGVRKEFARLHKQLG